MRRRLIAAVALIALAACGGEPAEGAPAPPVQAAGLETAVFAGGCFWSVEANFEHMPGVVSAVSGFAGGRVANPSYEQVVRGGTGHMEAVQVTFDPREVSNRTLDDRYWRTIDPTVKNRQFCDVGSQYRSGIYWQTEDERKIAEASRDALLASGKFKEIHTEIAAASAFFPAEEYHQDYYKKNPIRYAYYRKGCGRDARIIEVWGSK